jgi:hypothetical protein
MSALPDIADFGQELQPEHDFDLPTITVLTTAELAECECHEFCERDHSNE